MSKSMILILLLATACSSADHSSRMEAVKKEIFKTEKAFEAMIKEQGFSAAFSYYADSSAVLNRGASLIQGRDSIRFYYQTTRSNEVSLEWTPDYVGVSSSLDLGYTYGKYLLTTTDSTGRKTESRGIFNTVWKRQSDGQWKYVWD